MKSRKERTSLKAKVCEMYANGVSQRDISIKTKMPMFEISKVIQRDYLGVIRSKTPVHVLKESKV